LIDRFLVTAERGGIRPVIAINKIDLIEPADLMDVTAPSVAPLRNNVNGWHPVTVAGLQNAVVPVRARLACARLKSARNPLLITSISLAL